jgi:hypothetical protein
MHDDVPAYGLWSLVIINSVVFILFAFSFFKPVTKRDWRTFGAFSAFLVVQHSDFDVLMPSHSRIGKFSGGRRISMLRATPG